MDISEFLFLDEADEKDVEKETFDPKLCEQKLMVMMIGLPCSGKTSYALNLVKINIFINNTKNIFNYIILHIMHFDEDTKKS